LCGVIFVSNKAWYIDLTENCPSKLSDHLKTSSRCVKCIFVNLNINLCHDCWFSANKLLLKETFSDLELKISATVTLFFQIILYKLGYWSFKLIAIKLDNRKGESLIPSLTSYSTETRMRATHSFHSHVSTSGHEIFGLWSREARHCKINLKEEHDEI
jgi:hypothetical protein